MLSPGDLLTSEVSLDVGFNLKSTSKNRYVVWSPRDTDILYSICGLLPTQLSQFSPANLCTQNNLSTFAKQVFSFIVSHVEG